jgi:DNA-binding Xre family transcriptional regulator
MGEMHGLLRKIVRFRLILLPVSPKLIIFAFNLDLFNMKDLNRIKVVLVEKKKTSKWLAEQLGKSPTTVSKWCTNTSQPDLVTLNKIASLLGIDNRDLLTSNQEK